MAHPTTFEGNPSRRTFVDEAGSGLGAIRQPQATPRTRPLAPTRRYGKRPQSQVDALKRYRTRIESARKWRQKRGFDKLWRRLIDLYSGKHFEHATKDDMIAVNVAFATINVIYPSVSVNFPKFTVSARSPEDDEKSVITEVVLNYWWKHYECRPEFRRAVKDSLVIGHGWVKTGYRYVEDATPLTDDEYADQFQTAVSEADDYASRNPELAGALPTNDEIAASIPDSKMVAVEDRPFVERVSPFDIFVDPEATSPNDMKWIAQRIIRPLEDARADEKYQASARKKLKASAILDVEKDPDETKRDRDRDDKNPDAQRVTIWEFYDLSKQTVCVFADSGDDYLVDVQPMPYTFGHPFEMVRNYDIPDEFYPMGDLEALEPLQQELDSLRSQAMNHRKRYARKFLYRAEGFNAEGRNALASDVDNTMVPVEDDRPFADLVSPMPIEQLPPEFYHQTDTIIADIDRVSGVSDYMRGAAPDIRRTATEASIISDAAQSRAADKLAIIEQSLAACANRLVQLAQQFLTGDQVARIVGNDGNPLWVPYTREDIQAEFDFEVEAGSTQPMNETFRRQQAIELLNSMQPYIPTGIVNLPELLRHTLQNGFGIRSPERFLQAPPPPMPMDVPPGGDPNAPMGGDPSMGIDPTATPQGAGAPPGAPPPGGDIPPELLQLLAGGG